MVNKKTHFNSLKQGLVGFFTGKKEEIKQDIEEKLLASNKMAAQFNQMPTKVTTQLNQTLSKVKSNIKQAQTDFN